MIINFQVNGAFMGQETSLGKQEVRKIKGRAITCDPIKSVEIIRNGEVAYTVAGNRSNDLALDWEDDNDFSRLVPKRELTEESFTYYYMRVETVYGSIGWSSPVWCHA